MSSSDESTIEEHIVEQPAEYPQLVQIAEEEVVTAGFTEPSTEEEVVTEGFQNANLVGKTENTDTNEESVDYERMTSERQRDVIRLHQMSTAIINNFQPYMLDHVLQNPYIPNLSFNEIIRFAQEVIDATGFAGRSRG